MEELLSRQEQKAEEIQQLISNYKKDGTTRKTKTYLERKIAALKKSYNEYVDEDNKIRDFLVPLQPKHQYFTEREKVSESFTTTIADMRQRLNAPSCPSTPLQTSDETRPIPEFSFIPSEKVNNNTTDHGASTSEVKHNQLPEASTVESNVAFSQLPKFRQQLKQQDVRMRGLYREIRLTEDILASNNRSRPALKIKLKNMERMMMQIMDLHEQICMETSEEQEENSRYFVDQHYENLNDEYEKIVIQLTTLLEEEELGKRKPLEIRLPPVEIPHFHGDYMKWVGFSDTFKRLVHNNKQLTTTHKMNYLKSHIEGSAGKLLSHLEPTGDNYDAAWEILENRFNNRRLLVSNLLNTLLNQHKINTESAAAIKCLHDTTTECLHAIRNTGINIETWSPFIIFSLLKKLDNESRRLYESSLENPKEFQETNQFLKFLERRFQSLEAIGNNKILPTQLGRYQPQPLRRAFVTATQPSNVCVCCQKNHRTESCQRFKDLSISERNQMVMLHNLCRNCLSQSHSTTSCSIKLSCFTCKGRHHTLLHVKNQENSITKLNISTLNKDCGPVLLATALVKVQNIFGSFTLLRALIDPGSQATFITEQAAQQLGLPRTRLLTEISGISAKKGRAHQQI